MQNAVLACLSTPVLDLEGIIAKRKDSCYLANELKSISATDKARRTGSKSKIRRTLRRRDGPTYSSAKSSSSRAISSAIVLSGITDRTEYPINKIRASRRLKVGHLGEINPDRRVVSRLHSMANIIGQRCEREMDRRFVNECFRRTAVWLSDGDVNFARRCDFQANSNGF